LSDDALSARLQPWFERVGLWHADLDAGRREWFCAVLTLLRPRCKRLGEFVEAAQPFLSAPTAYDPEGAAKHLGVSGLRGHLEALRGAFADVTAFGEAELERTLRLVADTRGVKAGVLIHATRLAMTGRTVSPGLFEMLRLLGPTEVLQRLDRLAGTLT
jgi:glutamyl-tRNA synthetase